MLFVRIRVKEFRDYPIYIYICIYIYTHYIIPILSNILYHSVASNRIGDSGLFVYLRRVEGGQVDEPLLGITYDRRRSSSHERLGAG